MKEIPSKRIKMNHKKSNTNTTVIFDEIKRKEFLCGFRKRKIFRQQKAHEELKQQIRMEKKSKKTVEDSYKKIFSSQKQTEVQELSSKKLQIEGHTISISDLSMENIKSNVMLELNSDKVMVQKHLQKNGMKKRIASVKLKDGSHKKKKKKL